MAEMSHRERVLMALNHQEPDRIPLDLGGKVATMTDVAYYKLKDYLKIDGNAERVNEEYSVYIPDERILQRFDIDFRRVSLKGILPRINPDGSFVNEWGITQKKVCQQTGHYAEIIGRPLAHASIEDIDKHPWPDPHDPERVKGLRGEAEYLYGHTDYAISAAAISGGILEFAIFLRGYEQFLVDMMQNKKFAIRLLEKICDVQKGIYEIYMDTVGEYIHMVELHDDYGMQTGLIISPNLYREIVKPYHMELIKIIRRKTKAKIFHHSCGSIVDLLDEMIDTGVDIINPLQPSAAGMGNPEELKKRFGKRVCFHGGIDEQYVLPRGTTQEVEEEVRRRIRGFAPGGGYILAAAHNIQADTPPENVIAMFKAAQKYGCYPISL